MENLSISDHHSSTFTWNKGDNVKQIDGYINKYDLNIQRVHVSSASLYQCYMVHF
jgi:hypothetical protein